ncbi:MAG: DUF1150 family protein [Hyphomicrobiaceae bacterium]
MNTNDKSMYSSEFEMNTDATTEAVMSELELAHLGDGEVAYIKTMTSDEASEMFPTIEGLPNGVSLYALHAADGTPLALTDTHSAAVGHALGDELEIAAVH